MGMGLGGDLQPEDIIAVPGFLGEGDKGGKVVVVKKPASTKNIEDVKD